MALFKAFSRFAGITFVSRVFGFARDVFIARAFGSSEAADAFFVAFRIPNLFRRMFAEGAFSQAFIPILSEERNKEASEQPYINAVFSALAFTLFVFCSLGMLAAPWVITLFSPGFAQNVGKTELAVDLLILTFPYLFFISLSALFAGILNTLGQFSAAAFAPVFLNISLIIAALFGTTYFDQPIIALGWGVFAAGIIQLLWLWHFVRRAGYRIRLTYWRTKEVKKTVRLMIPALLGVSVAQINLLVDTILASLLVSGSVSWLYYSDRLLEFPLGIVGVAIGTVILPAFSKHIVQGNHQAFQNNVNWALKLGAFVSLPATAGLLLLSYPLLLTLFAYGAFSVHDAHMASLSLMGYVVGLPAFVLIKIMAPAFFAQQDTKTPAKIAIIALIANVILNLILMGPLKHAGLALATALSGWLNALLLMWFLHKAGLWQINKPLITVVLKQLLSVFIMVVVVLGLLSLVQSWESLSFWYKIAQLLGIIFAGALSYLASTALMGISIMTLMKA